MRRLSSPLALVSLMATAGCGDDAASSEQRTATVGVGDHGVEYTLDECRLDGDTYRLAGRGESGELLEAEFEAVSDGETLVTDDGSLVLTDFDQGEDLAVYGKDAWARRGTTGDPPGNTLTVRITDTLVQMAGQVAVVDDEQRPIDDEARGFVLDADCLPEG